MKLLIPATLGASLLVAILLTPSSGGSSVDAAHTELTTLCTATIRER